MKIFYMIFLTGIIITMGCNNQNLNDSLEKTVELIGTQWQVESFESAEGASSDVGTVELYLRFLKNKEIRGSGLNSFLGTYEISNDSIFTNVILVTEKCCEPEGSRLHELMGAFGGDTVTYQLENNRLTLFYGEKRAIKLTLELE